MSPALPESLTADMPPTVTPSKGLSLPLLLMGSEGECGLKECTFLVAMNISGLFMAP